MLRLASARCGNRRRACRDRRASAVPGYPRTVGPIATLRFVRRLRRHRAALSAICALSFALAAHHGAWAKQDAHHAGGTGAVTVAEVCLGVFAAVAAAAAVTVGLIRLGRWRPATSLGAAGLLAPAQLNLPQPRAGPATFRFLSVDRR